MANLSGSFRLGRDAERVTTDSGSFLSLSLAYSVFTNGESKTQWIKATLGGSRADSLEDKLVKGAHIDAVINDPHIVTFTGNDGQQRSALEGRIIDVDYLAPPRSESGQSAD